MNLKQISKDLLKNFFWTSYTILIPFLRPIYTYVCIKPAGIQIKQLNFTLKNELAYCKIMSWNWTCKWPFSNFLLTSDKQRLYFSKRLTNIEQFMRCYFILCCNRIIRRSVNTTLGYCYLKLWQSPMIPWFSKLERLSQSDTFNKSENSIKSWNLSE
jgi:hypothetical protein